MTRRELLTAFGVMAAGFAPALAAQSAKAARPKTKTQTVTLEISGMI
jgi:hypothetical protein